MPGNIAEKLEKLADPIVQQLGYRVWDSEFVKEGTEYYLRLYIDSDTGISSDDCEKVSRAMDVPLEEADLIDHAYIFEVCSPGIERRLRKPWQFEQYAGEKICLHLYKAEDGSKEYIGILEEYSPAGCRISLDGVSRSFELKNIASARTVFDF